MVVWPVPENVDITVTLYRVEHQSHFINEIPKRKLGRSEPI